MRLYQISMGKRRNIFFIIILVIVSGCSDASYNSQSISIENQKQENIELRETVSTDEQEISEMEKQPQIVEEESLTIPDEFNLEMQFYPQAPYANWSLPYQEMCEEASVLVAMNYIFQKNMTRKKFDEELLRIMTFENEKFGDYKHTDVKQTKEIIEFFYDYPLVSELVNPSIEDIKKAISEGNPVLVPLSGRGIGNPFYTRPGPVYHFLVIKGYTEKEFITHDVGTKRGENFRYPFSKIMDNIHDYAESIRSGEKKILIVEQTGNTDKRKLQE